MATPRLLANPTSTVTISMPFAFQATPYDTTDKPWAVDDMDRILGGFVNIAPSVMVVVVRVMAGTHVENHT